MKEGKKYKVFASDCCMNVTFTSVLLKIEKAIHPENILTFENGVVLEAGTIDLEEV